MKIASLLIHIEIKSQLDWFDFNVSKAECYEGKHLYLTNIWMKWPDLGTRGGEGSQEVGGRFTGITASRCRVKR